MIQNQNTKVGLINDRSQPKVKNLIKSLSHLLAIINKKTINQEVKEELIKQASSYPQGCLEFFYNNLENKISDIQNKMSPQIVVQPAPIKEEEIKETVKKDPVRQRKPLFDQEIDKVVALQKRQEREATPPPSAHPDLNELLRQAESRGQKE